MVKKVIGWALVAGSVGVVVAFVLLAVTHQISQPSTYVRVVFVPPIAFFYGLSLIRSSARAKTEATKPRISG